jgi:hypothetical protein
MGQRVLRVAGELIRHVLKLPDTCRVVGLSADQFFNTDEWAVKVESPDFPEVLPGHVIPEVSAGYGIFDGQPVFNGWIGLADKPVVPTTGFDPAAKGGFVANPPAPTVAPPPEPPRRGREFI